MRKLRPFTSQPAQLRFPSRFPKNFTARPHPHPAAPLPSARTAGTEPPHGGARRRCAACRPGAGSPQAGTHQRAARIPARAGRARHYGCRERTKNAARSNPRAAAASRFIPLPPPGCWRGRGLLRWVWPPEGAGPGAGWGRGAGRSLAVEQKPPPFWFRRLGRSRAEAAAARSGSRPGSVPEDGREDAARRSPSSVPAVLSLTR